ncbi:hypothetical protein L9F63_009713, partial [Diploptera punctata]
SYVCRVVQNIFALDGAGITGTRMSILVLFLSLLIFHTILNKSIHATSIMFSVYAEKRNLIESTKEFNWKNRRIGVILRVADVFVYDENNGSGFIAENSGWFLKIEIDPLMAAMAILEIYTLSKSKEFQNLAKNFGVVPLAPIINPSTSSGRVCFLSFLASELRCLLWLAWRSGFVCRWSRKNLERRIWLRVWTFTHLMLRHEMCSWSWQLRLSSSGVQ